MVTIEFYIYDEIVDTRTYLAFDSCEPLNDDGLDVYLVVKHWWHSCVENPLTVLMVSIGLRIFSLMDRELVVPVEYSELAHSDDVFVKDYRSLSYKANQCWFFLSLVFVRPEK